MGGEKETGVQRGNQGNAASSGQDARRGEWSEEEACWRMEWMGWLCMEVVAVNGSHEGWILSRVNQRPEERPGLLLGGREEGDGDGCVYSRGYVTPYMNR